MKQNQKEIKPKEGAIPAARMVWLVLWMLAFLPVGTSQDLPYVRNVVNTLASPEMAGRGYQYEADRKAARFIREELKAAGVQPLGNDYFQPVVFPVNSIVGQTHLSLDGKTLMPGVDYFISARSKGVDKKYRLLWLTKEMVTDARKMKRLKQKDLSGTILVIDTSIQKNSQMGDFYKQLYYGNPLKAAGMIRLADKPGWHISDGYQEIDYLVLTIREELVSRKHKTLSVKFSNHFEPEYNSQNVAGMIRGSVHPDSFIVFTAHYDHLGMMGTAVLPGANDNASGTAFILDLARYYAKNQPEYSVAFLAFTGEEAGLLGSTHYAAKPLFPLEQISMLINFDMVGTGSDGITVVNGSVFEEDFNRLDSLNRAEGLLKQVKVRGESANSDHHPFHKQGVKAFFIYTMGDEFREYHNIYDAPEALPFTAYESLFRLMVKFIRISM